MNIRMNITLPIDLARDFRRTIPNRSRSKFIAKAIKDMMVKQDLKDQLYKSAQAQSRIIRQIQEDFKYVDEEEFSKLP